MQFIFGPVNPTAKNIVPRPQWHLLKLATNVIPVQPAPIFARPPRQDEARMHETKTWRDIEQDITRIATR